MATQKLNVLVYSGTGTTSESVRHCLLTLRRLLYPNYAVIPINETVLLREPWQATCALLVIPGGADMSYSHALNGAGNRRIAQYVRAGGRYLGLCAGGYYGSSRCEFELGNKPLEVVGRRELGLFRGTCRGCAYKGFAYNSEAGARAVQLTIHAEAFLSPSGSDTAPSVDLPATAYSYYNGGGVFVDAAKSASAGVQVLASYPDDIAVDGGKGGQRAAIVYCPVGEGAALLTGPHPEFEPANLVEHPELPAYKDLLRTLYRDDETTQARVRLFKACLVKLGLELGNGSAFQPRLTALHVTSLYPDEAQELAYYWEEILSKKGDNNAFIRCEADTFRVLLPDSGASAWPSQANVAATASPGEPGGDSKHLPFSVSMVMDLTDRALRYPKLGDLIMAVSHGTASMGEQSTFRAILRAIANHDEEADDDDDSSPSTNAGSVSLTTQPVNQWREGWRKHREAFDATIDAVYRAVGRSLLGHQDDVPVLDADMRQEMWSSLVHAWEKKRTQDEEREMARRKPDDDTSQDSVGPAEDEQAARRMQLVDEVAGDDADDGTIKRIVVYEHGWPSRIAAFDLGAFYRALATYRLSPLVGRLGGDESRGDNDADYEWGNQLMYAKVTTSTNTLLEKNPKLLDTLPTGFTFTATRQLAARGRGSNVWLAPEGQLILSTVINHPHRFPAAGLGSSGNSALRPVIFIQYLAAVAIVEAIHGYAPGFEALNVKLKWPNDIYALDPTAASSPSAAAAASGETTPNPSSHKYLKIGGILSHCSFSNGHYQVVLGIGLNAVNRRPTTSLEALVPDALRASVNGGSGGTGQQQQIFQIEKLLASVLVRFEALYKQFCRQGFAGDLERRYYRHWLHSNQLVTLEAVEGSPRARVLGITSDWGLLQAAEVVPDGSGGGVRQTGRVWKLQSDENSFDYWKGLVRTKI